MHPKEEEKDFFSVCTHRDRRDEFWEGDLEKSFSTWGDPIFGPDKKSERVRIIWQVVFYLFWH